MRNKATAILLSIALCVVFLSGCTSSWHREVPSSSTYEEINETDQEESKSENDFVEQPSDSEETKNDFGKTEDEEETILASDVENKKEVQNEKPSEEIVISAKVSANNETIWKTQDDMLAQKLFDLLLHKQEQQYNDKNVEDADFLIQIETANNQKSNYYVWGNLQQKNELLVADEESHSWSLTKEDSSHVRAIINGV